MTSRHLEPPHGRDGDLRRGRDGLQLPPRRAARGAAALAPGASCERGDRAPPRAHPRLPRARCGTCRADRPLRRTRRWSTPRCYVMPVLVEDATRRDAVRRHLRDATACRRASSIPPCTSSPPTASATARRRCRSTEYVARAEITLPLHPGHGRAAMQDRVVGALAEALRMSWDIPLTDVVLDEEDLEAVGECLRSGWLTMGPRTKAFEAAVADRPGFAARRRGLERHGGAAPRLRGARARPRRRGDRPEPSRSWRRPTRRATSAPRPCCATSSRPQRPNIDPEDVRAQAHAAHARRSSPCTCSAIRPTWPALRALCAEHGLALIEDAAQGFGVDATAAADVACLSFFSKKQLAVGEGGMVLTRRRGRSRRGSGCCARTP